MIKDLEMWISQAAEPTLARWNRGRHFWAAPLNNSLSRFEARPLTALAVLIVVYVSSFHADSNHLNVAGPIRELPIGVPVVAKQHHY